MAKPIDELYTNINKCPYCVVGILETNKGLCGCLLDYKYFDRVTFNETCTVEDMYKCPRFFEKLSR